MSPMKYTVRKGGYYRKDFFMKIKVKQLNKTFEVKPTNSVLRKVYRFELDSAKLSADATENTTKMFESGIKLIDLVENYLKDVLGLTKSQVEKIDTEMEQSDLSEMANYVSSRLMGMSDKEIQEQNAATEEAPKESTGNEESGN